jgi:hypothetical protein
LIAELDLYPERAFETPDVDRVSNAVDAISEVDVFGRAAHNRDIGPGGAFLEPTRQETIVFEEPDRGQQTGRRHTRQVTHHRLVDLHLVRPMDLTVVRLIPRSVDVAVVPLDRSLHGHCA